MSQTQSMAVANPIPGMLTNAKIYRDGKEQLGVGTVNLPSFDSETASVKGFGIAGDISMPVLGHFKPMSVDITWTSVTDNVTSLLEPKAHHLDVRGNLQEYDPGSGEFVNKPVKVVLRAVTKSSSLGNWEAGKIGVAPKTGMEVTYIKVWINGRERVEVDKFNSVFKVDGKDMLHGLHANLGM